MFKIARMVTLVTPPPESAKYVHLSVELAKIIITRALLARILEQLRTRFITIYSRTLVFRGARI